MNEIEYKIPSKESMYSDIENAIYQYTVYQSDGTTMEERHKLIVDVLKEFIKKYE